MAGLQPANPAPAQAVPATASVPSAIPVGRIPYGADNSTMAGLQPANPAPAQAAGSITEGTAGSAGRRFTMTSVGQERALQIVSMEGDKTEKKAVLNAEGLQVLQDILTDSGAEKVCIVSVMGAARKGKSFLLTLMLRRLRRMQQEESTRIMQGKKLDGYTSELDGAYKEMASKFRIEAEDQGIPLPSWVSDGNATKFSEGKQAVMDKNGKAVKDGDVGCDKGFGWRGGDQPCTEGIWIWGQPIIFFDNSNSKIAVLLMDTQGSGAGDIDKQQSAVIYGLTTVISSRLIYNVPQRLDDNLLDYLDFLTTFASAVDAVGDSAGGDDKPFGNLSLLVRDWATFDGGWSLEQWRNKMQQHVKDFLEPKSVQADAVGRVTRLQGAFEDIRGEGFCHPGLKIDRPGWDGSLKDISDDFFFLVEDFFARIFDRSSFPVASKPCGFQLEAGTFQQVMTNLVGALKDANITVSGLRDAVVDLAIARDREQLQIAFKEAMERNFSDMSIFEDADLRARTLELKTFKLAEFEKLLRKLKPSDKVVENEKQTLAKFMDEIIEWRVGKNEQILKGGMMKLVMSPGIGLVAFFIYPHYWVWGTGIVGGLGVTHYFNSLRHGGGQAGCMAAGAVNATCQDTGGCLKARVQDVQAVTYALKGCSPEKVEAMVDQGKGQIQMAGNMAQAGAAMQAAPAPR